MGFEMDRCGPSGGRKLRTVRELRSGQFVGAVHPGCYDVGTVLPRGPSGHASRSDGDREEGSWGEAES